MRLFNFIVELKVEKGKADQNKLINLCFISMDIQQRR